MKELIFRSRAHAGQLLAAALMHYAKRTDVIVLGLPRGGVPVAFEVAQQLQAPLDVLAVRKLGVPGYEELAMGAIASGGVQVVHHDVMRALSIPRAALEAEAVLQRQELQRRELAYRGHAGAPAITGKSVILVDDGIATGSTIRAALQVLRQQSPKHIIIAVPTVARDSYVMLKSLVDELIGLVIPADFRSVGQWYDDFAQTTDEQVADFMDRARTPVCEPASFCHSTQHHHANPLCH